MASTKISAMTAATDLASSVIPIVQGGVNKKAADTLFIKNAATNTLTGNTTIDGATYDIDVKIDGNTAGEVFRIKWDKDYAVNGAVYLQGTNSDGAAAILSATDIKAEMYSFNGDTVDGSININNGAINMYSQNGTDSTSLNISPNSITTGNTGTGPFLGIQYDADYTANFGLRSLVDKDYVDTAVSDARLKDNITDLPSSLETIARLRPVEFDMIKDGEHKAGFIAQELEEVFPSMVVEESGIKKIKRDQLVPYLVKCIQELTARVEELERR